MTGNMRLKRLFDFQAEALVITASPAHLTATRSVLEELLHRAAAEQAVATEKHPEASAAASAGEMAAAAATTTETTGDFSSRKPFGPDPK